MIISNYLPPFIVSDEGFLCNINLCLQSDPQYFWFWTIFCFLPYIVVSQILFLPVFEFLKEISIIYAEPEVQLAAREEGSGNS